MPLAAPVITATLPSSLPIDFNSYYWPYFYRKHLEICQQKILMFFLHKHRSDANNILASFWSAVSNPP
jgi:hypothetical protein